MDFKVEWKEVLENSKKFVSDAVEYAKEKEVGEKAVKLGSTLVKGTVRTAGELTSVAAKKTKEAVAAANPESRTARILELEKELEAKEKEIRTLKRKLAKKSWKK